MADEKDRPTDAGERHSYRQGGAPKGGRSGAGPGSHGWTDAGAKSGGPSADPSAGGGQGQRYAERGAPGEPPRTDHPTYGGPSPDLGRGWGQAPAPRDESAPSMPAPAGGAYEGWSGRTGQDYHGDGQQSFEQPTGPWARGTGETGPASADWHAERSDGTPPPAAGDPDNFRGEAAYNQSVREPYGGYQGGYPGEAPVSERYSDAYASWRAEQLRKLDEDYAAWCRERQERFSRDFADWQRARTERPDRQSETSNQNDDGSSPDRKED